MCIFERDKNNNKTYYCQFTPVVDLPWLPYGQRMPFSGHICMGNDSTDTIKSPYAGVLVQGCYNLVTTYM